jgi:transposase
MSHSVLITGPERRRRWRDDEKQAILMAAFSPGAVVVEVARQHEISTSLIYKWRSDAMAMAARSTGDFVPAVVVEDPDNVKATAAAEPAPAIVVELASGARVTIGATATVSMVTAALRALR